MMGEMGRYTLILKKNLGLVSVMGSSARFLPQTLASWRASCLVFGAALLAVLSLIRLCIRFVSVGYHNDKRINVS